MISTLGIGGLSIASVRCRRVLHLAPSRCGFWPAGSAAPFADGLGGHWAGGRGRRRCHRRDDGVFGVAVAGLVARHGVEHRRRDRCHYRSCSTPLTRRYSGRRDGGCVHGGGRRRRAGWCAGRAGNGLRVRSSRPSWPPSCAPPCRSLAPPRARGSPCAAALPRWFMAPPARRSRLTWPSPGRRPAPRPAGARWPAGWMRRRRCRCRHGPCSRHRGPVACCTTWAKPIVLPMVVQIAVGSRRVSVRLTARHCRGLRQAGRRRRPGHGHLLRGAAAVAVSPACAPRHGCSPPGGGEMAAS